MSPNFLSEAKTVPAECEIFVDGEEIESLYVLLLEVTAECSRQEASVAALKFESRRDESGTWPVQDDDRIRTWRKIVINAVFGEDTEEVFRGYIREIRAEYPESPGAATVTVECQDDSILLDREHVRRAWGADAPTSDAVILDEIAAARHGLAVHADSADGQSGLTLNQDATDITFLRERAEANGYELIFLAGEVYFGPMRLEAAPQPTIMVYAGASTHCITFSVRVDGHQPDQIAVDVPDQSGSEGTRYVVDPDLASLGTEPADSSDAGLGAFVWLLDRPGGAAPEDLLARAQQRVNEAAMRLFAEGELDGSAYGHVLRTAEPVQVDGIGDRLAGTYYVDTVSHRFDPTGYRQTFKLLRNALGDNVEPSDDDVLAPVR